MSSALPLSPSNPLLPRSALNIAILLRRYTLSAIVLTLSRSCAFLFVFDSKTFIDVSLKTAFCDPVVYYWLSFSSAAAVTTHS